MYVPYVFFLQFLVPYSKSPLSSSMGANQKPAKIPQNEEVDRIELRKNDESARINLEKAKGKYSDKMKTLKTKMKKVKEEQKDLETNLIKFNAFVKEKQLKVRERPLMMSDFRGDGGGSEMTPNLARIKVFGTFCILLCPNGP